MLSQVENKEDLIRAIGYLCDSEYINHIIPRELAICAVTQIFSFCEEDINYFLNSIISCLQSINQTKADLVQPWRRIRFREWLLNEFCRILMEFEGMNGFKMLVDIGWFKPQFKNFQNSLLVEMEREASIAIGYHYRRSKEAPREILIHLESLIDKKLYKSACWIIYHTARTSLDSETGQGKITPIVDVIFHQYLVEIKKNVRSKNLGRILQNFLKENNV